MPGAFAGVDLTREHTDPNEFFVNRLGAARLLALLAYLVWLNRSVARTTVIGVWFVACGAGLNAAATLAYGAMPVLGSAARAAGYEEIVGTSGPPFPGCVLSDQMSPVARYLGDFIPIPEQLTVINIGDLMLIVGLLLVFLQALRSVSRPRVAASSSA